MMNYEEFKSTAAEITKEQLAAMEAKKEKSLAQPQPVTNIRKNGRSR